MIENSEILAKSSSKDFIKDEDPSTDSKSDPSSLPTPNSQSEKEDEKLSSYPDLFAYGTEAKSSKKRKREDNNEMVVVLDKEIREFAFDLLPSLNESRKREETIRFYCKSIDDFFRSDTKKAYVFGSSATGLAMYKSDIDIVIYDSSKSQPLSKQTIALILSNLSKRLRRYTSELTVIRHATVPLIKLKDSQTGLQVDISYQENDRAIKAVETTKKYLSELPALKPLVLVLKEFLRVRGLNNNATSGLGGYAVVLLVTSFLKIHSTFFTESLLIQPTKKSANRENLGVILMDFFKFFGSAFNYETLGLAAAGLPGYPNVILFHKEKQANHLNTRNQDYLCLMDPNDETNDVSRGCSRIREIIYSFQSALKTLEYRSDYEVEFGGKRYEGYLSRIL